MSRIQKAISVAAVLAATSVGSLAAAQPASAHIGSWSKSRSGCLYVGGVSSFHNYAFTRKDHGSCAGHAWLQVQYTNGTWSTQLHAPVAVEIYGSILHAYHKSQSGESWGQSH